MLHHGWIARFAPWLLLAAIVLFTGCGDGAKSPVDTTPPADEQIGLNAPNGGYTSAPEAPAFGDANLQAEAEAEVEFTDAFEDDPTVRDLAQRAGAKLYLFTAYWGRLEDHTSADRPQEDGVDYDWDGSLTLDRGALVLRSTVSFERADGDSILARQSRNVLAWQSHTGGGLDGIRVLVILPPSIAGEPAVDDTLEFVAGGYARAFALPELDRLDEVVPADENGNEIALHAYRIDPTDTSPGGTLRGRWGQLAEGDSVATFEGVWVGPRGSAAGLFQGIYGVNAEGEQVFFGKIIGRDGAFVGLLRGTWGEAGPDPNLAHASHVGWFRGSWLNAAEERQGEVRGHWQVVEDRGGFLRGRWCRGDCTGNGM